MRFEGRIRSGLVLSAALLASALGAPVAATAGEPVEPVFEDYRVPTVGGAEIAVEVMRPKGEPNAPVILTYSPYNSIYESRSGNLANDDIGQRYMQAGYARAVADVLGTRNSSGCWDYGGLRETRSGVDLVNFLGRRSWSNGRVGMIGGSYDGTTATMVASRGKQAPHLKAIVPIAAISRWYGYAYSSGVRYAGNTENPTDEGADTPLAFDFGLTRTPPTDPTDPNYIDLFLSRVNPCDSVEHTERGYDDSPDYNRFWVERDYRRHASRFRAATLIAHGWQDYNVKQEEAISLYRKLREDDPRTKRREGVPFKRLYMFQGPHDSPDTKRWNRLLDRFFAKTLEGRDNGVDRGPAVITESRSADRASTGFRNEADWPPRGVESVRLRLARRPGGGALRVADKRAASIEPARATYTDTATQTEEESRQNPAGEMNWLFYRSRALSRDTRMAGSARLVSRLSVDRAHAHLTPVLVDIARDGTTQTVSRGFLNLSYRDGLRRSKPLPVGKPVSARLGFKPQDQRFEKGHRIGVLMQSSNSAWAVPDDPGATVTVHHRPGRRGSSLSLPLVDPPANHRALFQHRR